MLTLRVRVGIKQSKDLGAKSGVLGGTLAGFTTPLKFKSGRI
jgi:hypothetical protein